MEGSGLHLFEGNMPYLPEGTKENQHNLPVFGPRLELGIQGIQSGRVNSY
jgi:hypothetical protein